MSEPIYQCVRCGKKATKSQWERGGPALDDWERKEREKRGLSPVGGIFKCPYCSYKVCRKIRSPRVKRVKAK